MDIDNIYLGQKVKISRVVHDNEVFMVKKIDTDQEMVYIVSMEDGTGFWRSAAGVFYFKGE